MKLSEALDIIRLPLKNGLTPKVVDLICGFTPLHLATFLTAHARLRLPKHGIEVRTGLFGDLHGNMERATRSSSGEAAVVVEWSDLDRRLGLRDGGGWSLSAQADIIGETERSLDRLLQLLRELLRDRVAALSPPTLPLPPAGATTDFQDGWFELHLNALIASFLSEAVKMDGLRIVARQRLDEASPPGARLDAKGAVESGFPYTLAHADALAGMLAELLYPRPPMKGLITDLDGTLWKGILGERGVDGVAWDLAGHAQHHALYQQFLAALAERGVLVAVASKNQQSLVKQALQREDILLPESRIFPVEAHWHPKSTSVGRILRAWNIAPDSVVFVDDSAMELAEVHASYPEITALPFPEKDPNGVWQLLWRLRGLFGRPAVLEEDRIRSASLRASEQVRGGAAEESSGEFLSQLAATVAIDYSREPRDERAFELVNKTNQFNLNGRRYTQAEWRSHLQRPEAFLVTVSYQDKFGPLGRIAVATGTWDGSTLRIASWVMSCRAFSRRIEHRTLECLFRHFGTEEIEFDYAPTGRNQPLRDFFENLLDSPPSDGSFRIARLAFDSRCPDLHHRVTEANYGNDDRTPPGVLFQSIP